MALARYGRESRCLDVAVDIAGIMAQIDIGLTSITRTSNTIQAKGKGYYSDQDLI